MTDGGETVYIVSRKTTAGRVYHTDRDCHRLTTVDGNMREVDRETIETHRELCKWCGDEIDGPPFSAGTHETRAMLIEADPEDVGLSPIGERGERV